MIAGAGIVAGAVGGLVLARVVGSYIPDVRIPGALPIVGAAVVLVAAAILASLMPAAPRVARRRHQGAEGGLARDGPRRSVRATVQ